MILAYNKIIPKGRYSWYTYDNVNLFDRTRLGVRIFESVNKIKFISANRKEQSILMDKAKGTSLRIDIPIYDIDKIIKSIIHKLNILGSLPKHKDLEVFDLDKILKIWKTVGDKVKIKKKYIDEVEDIFNLWKDRDYPRGVIHGDLGIQNIMHNGYEVTDIVDFEEVSWGYPILDATEIFLDLYYNWGSKISSKFLKYYNKDLIPRNEVEIMQRTRYILLTAMVRKMKLESTIFANEGWAKWANFEWKDLDYYLEN